MAKRKPPSKRQERKMDDAARAIARLRETAKPEKPVTTGRLGSQGSTPISADTTKDAGPRFANPPAPSRATKRRKKV